MSQAHNFKDITGQRFGRLTVLYRCPENAKDRKAQWVCKCDCGNIVIVTGKNLRIGNTKSCGCLQVDKVKEKNRKFGLLETKLGRQLYRVHYDMIRRCYYKDRHQYENYGGRGIYICDEWYTPGVEGNPGFVNFYHWMIDHGYHRGLEIDRIDNDGPYAPWNCRLVDKYTQNNNRRNNRYISDGVEFLTFRQFENKYQLSRGFVSRLLDHGYSYNEIVYIAKHQDRDMKHRKVQFSDTPEFADKDHFIHMIPNVNQNVPMQEDYYKRS